MRKNLLLVLAELGFWILCSLSMLWLYDRWLIPGPHGMLRWVGMDFVPYWVGVRNMLAGISPYGSATTHAIQAALLGGAPGTGDDPMLFVYPAWIFLVIAPWALLPLKWAVALWTGSLLSGVLHLIGALASHWGERNLIRTSLWAALLAFGSLPFMAIAVTKGQLSLISLGGLFLAIRLLSRPAFQSNHAIPGQKEPAWNLLYKFLAGVCLTFSILKPTLTLFPVAGILLWALIERKGELLAGFFSSLGMLCLVSGLAVGNWLPDYFQLLKTTGGAPVLWSLAILAWPWKALYAAFFVGLGIFAFGVFLRSRLRAQWFSAAILVGLALFPMRWIYDLLLGILVPAEALHMDRLATASLGLALLAPWGLALFPEPLRWPAQVIGLPLVWAIVWMALYRPWRK